MKKLIALLLALLYFLLLTPPVWGKTVVLRYTITTSKGYKLSQVTEQPAQRDTGPGGTKKSSQLTSSDKTALPPGSDIEAKIRRFFGKYAKTAKAIAMCESHLNPQAVGDGGIAYWQDGVEYGRSWGIFQIRYLPGRPHPTKLLDPDYNIQYAYQLFVRSGYTFTAWSCFTNKGYLTYL